MKKSLLLLVLSVFFLLAACGDTDSGEPSIVEDENDAKTENKDENTNEADEKAENPEFKIGDTIDLEGTHVTVLEIEKSRGNDFDTPKSGNEYIIVHVKIENKSDENITYNPFDFQLKNSKGQITDQAITIVSQDTDISSGELAPGGMVEGTIPFEAPVDDPQLQLIYQPDIWIEEKQVTIHLQ